ncbi:MAG: hypothetical protein RLZZ450_5490 [Pseudomonadota bacterium]|jgi:hypothetical protein
MVGCARSVEAAAPNLFLPQQTIAAVDVAGSVVAIGIFVANGKTRQRPVHSPRSAHAARDTFTARRALLTADLPFANEAGRAVRVQLARVGARATRHSVAVLRKTACRGRLAVVVAVTAAVVWHHPLSPQSRSGATPEPSLRTQPVRTNRRMNTARIVKTRAQTRLRCPTRCRPCLP